MKAIDAKPRAAWIDSPGVDLIVGCCLWSLPLLILGQVFTSSRVWIVSFYALALLFNYPHYMATIYRAYNTKEDLARYRFYTVYVTAILAAVLLMAQFSPRLLPWLVTIYITWSPWHYMGQNFGLAMMFIRRSGMEIERKDRNALWTAFVASYLMIFLSFHTNPSTNPNVISLQLPALLDTLRIPLMMVFLVLGVYPLSRFVRKAGLRPMLPAIVLYVTEFLWFVLPPILGLLRVGQLPPASYSAGVLALMHSAQYIWITSYYAKREAGGDSTWTWKHYFATLVVGGIALFIPGPWLAARIFHVDFSATVLAFAAVINIHHFILDGAVWKLREKRVASLLITNPTPAAAVEPALPMSRFRWQSVPLLAAALLLIAGLDQVRYYFSTRSDLGALKIAAAMVPYDSVIQSRLARGLLDEQRYDEAYEHYLPIVDHMRATSVALINFGLLCKRRGEDARAIESFNRAIELNPNSAPAQLHLAETLQENGKPEEAAEHFERYQKLLASDRDHTFVNVDH
jgi:Tetratricopeptide repeat